MNHSFLFWNMNKKPLWDRLANMILHHRVDVVMLAESPDAPSTVSNHLSLKTKMPFQATGYINAPCDRDPNEPERVSKLQVFTRLPERSLTPVFEDVAGHLAIHRLVMPTEIDLLLVVVHLPSKGWYSTDDQASVMVELARDIINFERQLDNPRTVIVGDFNMNPFEKGLVDATGLHAVMTRAIADKRKRIINKNEYRYFYNPMWSYFGDRSEGPAGTFYYAKATPNCYFWNMFDQVLLRPEIMHWLKDLRILDHDGSTSLLDSQGKPDASEGSDHLPLYFFLQS